MAHQSDTSHPVSFFVNFAVEVSYNLWLDVLSDAKHQKYICC